MQRVLCLTKNVVHRVIKATKSCCISEVLKGHLDKRQNKAVNAKRCIEIGIFLSMNASYSVPSSGPLLQDALQKDPLILQRINIFTFNV